MLKRKKVKIKYAICLKVEGINFEILFEFNMILISRCHLSFSNILFYLRNLKVSLPSLMKKSSVLRSNTWLILYHVTYQDTCNSVP